MSTQAIREEIKALNAKIAALGKELPQLITKTFANKVTVKIGEKGTLNFYGLGRMPICLYQSQLTRLLEVANTEDFRKFVAENQTKIATKKAE